jgi:hypothetical protein
MRFWDSSAVVPLLAGEPTTAAMRALVTEDREMAVWWSTEVECFSALARLERGKKLSAGAFAVAAARLHQLAADWNEVTASREIRETAKRLLRLHALTAADALQLAAALAAAENDPPSLVFVTLDDRLRDAASRQGFTRILP